MYELCSNVFLLLLLLLLRYLQNYVFNVCYLKFVRTRFLVTQLKTRYERNNGKGNILIRLILIKVFNCLISHDLNEESNGALEITVYRSYVYIPLYNVGTVYSRAVGKCPPCRCCCSEPPGKRKRSSDLRIRVTRGGATHLSSRQRLSAFLHRFPGPLDDFLEMSLERDLASPIVFLITARAA